MDKRRKSELSLKAERKNTLFADELVDEKAKGMLDMLRIPQIWLMVFAIVSCSVSLSFLDPTLEGQLRSVSERVCEAERALSSFAVLSRSWTKRTGFSST